MTEETETFSKDEQQSIVYMHDAILTFLGRSGLPLRLLVPAIMLADASYCSFTAMEDEEVVEEFRRCLKQARIIQAEKERADASSH